MNDDHERIDSLLDDFMTDETKILLKFDDGTYEADTIQEMKTHWQRLRLSKEYPPEVEYYDS